MQILYFGTVCNISAYERWIRKSVHKPSIAPVIFESALLSGFGQIGAELEVRSFPMVPSFLKSRIIGWGTKEEELPGGYTAQWIPTVNVAGIKQLSRYYYSTRIIKKWLKRTKGQSRAALIYSVCPYIAPSIIHLCKKERVPCFAIIPDLPQNMFLNRKFGKIKSILSKVYLYPALRCQDKFSGYIYLTEKMKEVVNPNAPFAVIEAIANVDGQNELMPAQKPAKRIIMYAGGLNEKYGIGNLIDAFLSIPHEDLELWLLGSGNMEERILEYTRQDPSVCFWGRVEHDKILEYERMATLLVNVRNANDSYTQYSFPSKTIEYMLSGTPVLSSRLPGIPAEYEKYLYMIENNSVEEIAEKLKSLLSRDKEELYEFGKAARNFVIREKNPKRQAEKIMKLMEKTEKEFEANER